MCALYFFPKNAGETSKDRRHTKPCRRFGDIFPRALAKDRETLSTSVLDPLRVLAHRLPNPNMPTSLGSFSGHDLQLPGSDLG